MKHVKEQLQAGRARLSDLQRALDRGIHRNELLVAAQQTIDELNRLFDEEPASAAPINRLLDRCEKLVAKLLE